jgi:PAS domain S-box-containing protein
MMANTSVLDQRLLQAILQSISHGVLLFEPDGQIIFANNFAEELLGFKQGEWRDNSIACLFLEEDCEIFLPNIIKLTREEGAFEGEALLLNRENQEFFAYFTTYLYRDGDTEIIIATIQDIGALKTLQHASIETDRVRSIAKVVDQMAHHIRNPIAAIGGFAARLLKKGLTDKDKELYQEIIFQEATRLDNLLRSLAEFTTLPFPALAEESLERLLDRALEMVPEPLRAAASEWHMPPPEELRSLRAFMDVEFLARCLNNVINNALESGNPEVIIDIQVATRDDRIQLSVSDNGSGINPKDLPSVFDPLFSTKNEHVGLVLTISRRIIRDHAGSINIESEVGQGTTVIMSIPKDKRRSIRVRRL